jgi:glycosyltransferase involved in cell wall biosynthesis
VHVPQAVRPVRADLAAQDLSFGVLYDTGEHRSLAPPLAGIAEATRGFADSVIVAAIEEATSRREARLWATGRKLKLLDRLSILPDMEARREPVLGMDFLLVPEAHGRQRTIVLEAMARGMAVVSPRDLAIDVLDDPHIVQLVSDNSPGGWSRAIRSLLMSPAALTDLTRAAHQHVRTHRSASGHIASVLRAYQQAVEAPAVATA